MKKLMLVLAVVTLVTSASAQQTMKTTLSESKLTDNWYVGVSGGVGALTTYHYWMNHTNPEAALRLGRWLTPVFGITGEWNAAFDNKPYEKRGTFVKYMNTSLLFDLNFSNFFGGYGIQPRRFEVIGVVGWGWGRTCGTASDLGSGHNDVTSTMGLDLVLNLDKKRAWQLYVEPALIYVLNGQGYDGLKYNLQQSTFQVNFGVNYKFRNSNGSHNFVRVAERNQYEIDKMNQELNELRYDLREKEKALARDARTISELREQLEKARQMVPATDELPDSPINNE